MKIFWCAMLILLIMIVGAYYFTFSLNQIMLKMETYMNELEEAATHVRWEESEKIVNDFIKDWNKTQVRLNSFIDHTQTDNVRQLICEIEGYSKTKNRDLLLVKIGVLRTVLNHIQENEKMSLENILKSYSTQNSQFFIEYSIPVKSSAFSVHINQEPSMRLDGSFTCKGREKMTNINCSKNCKFQLEGKCCCDSVVMTLNSSDAPIDSECPYQTLYDKEKAITDHL